MSSTAISQPLTPLEPLAPSALALLDERDEWLEFSRPQDKAAAQAGQGGGVWESNVVFEGMHCAACASTIEQALLTTPGVLRAEVSAASHRGRVVWDEQQTRPSSWMQAVQATGYRPLPAHNAFASERRQAETRKMMWRLGVAGVCMMQVMMYATPEYVTPPDEIGAEMVHLLRWAQWVISVPVMLFSCQPFFSNAWLDLRLRRISMDLPVALAMLITFVVSSLGTFEPQGLFGHEVYFDSLTMFVFFLLGGRWLELRLRDRTAGALEALMHRLPESVLRRDAQGQWVRVAARRVRVGDVLQVLPGEAFPADAVVLAGQTSVDEALLTGESTPLLRQTGDQVIAGSHNLTGLVEVQVQKVGQDTRYAQIVGLMEQASISKPQIALLADRVAKPFLILVLLAAGLACWWWWPTDPGRAVMVTVAVLVVTCPCALSLATPAAMLASAGALARRGVMVRNLRALETLAQVDTVVFDKTGTLTRDAFVLDRLTLRPGTTPEYALALASALASSSLHPISQAVVRHAQAQGIVAEVPQLRDLQEVMGQGIQAQTPEGVVRLGSAAFCGFEGAAAQGPVAHLSDAQGWLASFEWREDLRPDAKATVQALQVQGVQVRLLSGDRPEAAQRVAELTGIDNVRGACLPDDKLSALRQAQAGGARLAMVGDGLNDGPVLAGADVSFAFGRAVPLAQGRSDFVVLGDQLLRISECFAQAHKTMRIVRQNLAWAAAYNAIGVPMALVGWMPAWAAGLGMALSSLLVVANAWRLSVNGNASAEER